MTKYLSLFALFLLCFSSIRGQEAETPKLGLVLSGGGARGIAHVGIIRAMEEAGLRPDYIAGTSMGSIIAGLYAVGYNSYQIEEIILEVNWDQILSNKVPLNYISFEEKEYYDRYLVGIPLNKKLKPELGSGLLHGQMLTEVLHHHFWPALQYDDFDDLPIPFRCIATDVNSGKAIVFSEGSLPTALRSSMAIPSAFTAVDLDSTLAVDGGVVNNFPVDIVQQLGADYVVGINVGATSSGKEATDMGSIMMSLASLPSKENLAEHIEQCDVYIQPDLSEYSPSSFTKASEILEFGKQQGALHIAEFEALAKTMGMSKKAPRLDSVDKSLVLDSIVLEGNSLFSEALILKKLGLEEGQEITRSQLEEAIRRVYGINGFDKVDHELTLNAKDSASLKLKMEERSPYQLYASVHVDNIFAEGIVLNFTARDLLGKESRSIFAVDISGNPRFRFDYYKYLNVNKKFAFNFRYDFANEQIPTYDEGRPKDVLINRLNRVEVNVLNTQSLVSSFSVGGFYENLRTRSRFDAVSPEAIRHSTEEYYGVRLGWLRNNLNDRNFPVRGSESEFIIDNYLKSFYLLDYQDGVDSIELDVTDDFQVRVPTSFLDGIVRDAIPGYYAKVLYNQINYLPVTRSISIIPRATAALTLGENSAADLFDPFKTGGWQRVWRDDIPITGLHYNELTTNNLVVLGIQAQHFFWNNFFLKYGADAVGYYDYVPLSELKDDFDADAFLDENLFLGFGAELIWRTVFGPVSGGISSNTIDGQPRFYLALGFSFNYSD